MHKRILYYPVFHTLRMQQPAQLYHLFGGHAPVISGNGNHTLAQVRGKLIDNRLFLFSYHINAPNK
jgi:hypothetical protein